VSVCSSKLYCELAQKGVLLKVVDKCYIVSLAFDKKGVIVIPSLSLVELTAIWLVNLCNGSDVTVDSLILPLLKFGWHRQRI